MRTAGWWAGWRCRDARDLLDLHRIASHNAAVTTLPPSVSLTRRIWRGFWFALLVLALLFHIVGGWIFSGRIIDGGFVIKEPSVVRDVEVVSVEGGSIVLQEVDPGTGYERNSVMGFEHDGGYLRLGPVQSGDGTGTVTRSYEVVDGAAPTVGARGDIQGYSYPGDPQASGLDIEVVTYASDLGPMEAWQVDGSRSEWVIHVHGKGASPVEALRLMSALDRAGFHQLAITYRNDPGQPADPSGYYQYGREEWMDLAAAIDHAREQGATQVVVVGYSTGAAIALAYAYRTSDDLAAIVLDAPNLDMSATVDHRAAVEEVAFGVAPPGTLIATAKMLAGLRASINWSAIDYVKRIGQLAVPTLIFHRTEDEWVPIASSREAAEARPEFVTLVEVDGAGHVESWNADPASYEARALDFIGDALAG